MHKAQRSSYKTKLVIRSRNFKLNLEKSLDEVYCEHCHEEFEDQNSIMITSKIYQAESTDESGGLSYKSRNKNISEESFSGFKKIQNFYHSSNVLLHNKLSLSPCH